ncbi:MAG: UPF0179 family protein [Candidatus Bathyarchaeota archaeon]|nr:UPF0179 family protein [Candidatus Bathyarchaeota archaeon]
MSGEGGKRVKTIITLLGEGQARVGELFIHKGFGAKCYGCRYFNVCVKNLESGRVYRVVGLRDRVLKCEAYDIEMRVVEVVESEVLAALPSKQAILGALVTFHPQECGERGCENYELCSPEPLRSGDRCEIIEVYEAVRCPRDFQIRKVLLRRVSPS